MLEDISKEFVDIILNHFEWYKKNHNLNKYDLIELLQSIIYHLEQGTTPTKREFYTDNNNSINIIKYER